MNKERETITIPVLGPSALGLGAPVAVVGERQIPVRDPGEPRPKRDGLRDKIAMRMINSGIPSVLAILDEAHASGKAEIPYRRIQLLYENGPRKFLAPDYVDGILNQLEKDGQVRRRKITTEQAVELGLISGDNYSRIIPEQPAETIYESPSRQPQDLDLES